MSKEKEIERILRDDFKAVHEVQGVTKALAQLWRTILKDYNVELYEYNTQVIDYLRDPRNRISQNPLKRNSTRGNLADALFKQSGKMTWNTICKGFNIMKFTDFELQITTFQEGKPFGVVSTIYVHVRDDYRLNALMSNSPTESPRYTPGDPDQTDDRTDDGDVEDVNEETDPRQGNLDFGDDDEDDSQGKLDF